MVNVSENTFMSHDAKLSVLEAGSPAPESIDATFVGTDLGWLQEEGETFTFSKTVENIRGHQNRGIVRNYVSDSEQSFSAVLLEDKKAVRELYHGAVENELGVMVSNGGEAFERTFVYDTIDTQDGFEKKKRYVFKGLITPNGDIVYTPTNIATYPVMVNVRGGLTIMSEIVAEETPEALSFDKE